MQASVRKTDRAVVQVGESLGIRADALIVELTEQNVTDLRDAFGQPHGLIYLAEDGAVTFDPYVPPTEPTPDPQIQYDKDTVGSFMNALSGSATAIQRDDVIKAVIRFIRRSGA